jgi:hypothetical protein
MGLYTTWLQYTQLVYPDFTISRPRLILQVQNHTIWHHSFRLLECLMVLNLYVSDQQNEDSK